MSFQARNNRLSQFGRLSNQSGLGVVSIGSPNSRNWTAPFKSDLLEDMSLRSGSSLIDSVSGSAKATILTASYLQGASSSATMLGDMTRTSEKLLDGGSYTIYCKFKKVIDVPDAGIVSLFLLGGGTVAARRGLYFVSNANRGRLYVNDGTLALSGYSTPLTSFNSIINNTDIYELFINIDGTGKMITGGVYLNSVQQGTDFNLNIATLTLNSNNNYTSFVFNSKYIAIENFKKFNAIKTLSQCQNDSYSADIQIHIPQVFSGIDISGNGQDFSRSNITTADISYQNVNTWVHDHGFGWYEYTGMDMSIPYSSVGAKIMPNRAIGAYYRGAKIQGEYTGGGLVGIQNGGIRFTNTFFDRSNATIWEDAARLGYYNAADTKFFHFSELNQRTLLSWLKNGYKGRLAVKVTDNSIEQWDRKYLSEILLYTTDHKGSEQAKIYKYTKDIFASIKSEGVDSLDGNGYIQLGYKSTNQPMITLRFDDTRAEHLTWKNLLHSLGIDKAVTGVHAAQCGQTIGSVTFATWEQVQELYAAGWEISCHNRTDSDYNSDIEFIDTIYEDMVLGISEQVAQGIPCNIYIGNKHSSESVSTPYSAHKAGFKAHIAWGTSGYTGNYANPVILNIYQLNAIATDINIADHPELDFYFIDKADNATELANLIAQIDLCVSENRWLIIMIHNYTSYLATAITTASNYALGEGVGFVTPSEALLNMEYK